MLERVAEGMMEKADEFARAEEQRTPDDHWQLVCQTIVAAGKELYARQPYSAAGEERKHRAERDALLRRRAAARASLGRREVQEREASEEREPTPDDERILELTKELRRLARRRLRAKVRSIESDLAEAWEKRKLSECFRLAHRLAGKGGASRDRKLGHMAAVKPTVQEWRDFLQAPGAAGGMSAIDIDYEGEIKRMKDEADPLPVLD